jgi:hypothetical protein
MRLLTVCMLPLIASLHLHAQTDTVIDKVGGFHTVSVSLTKDLDKDGIDDLLESKLLKTFLPKIIEISDNCPGPGINTSNPGDSNIIISRIFFIPQQYIARKDSSLISLHPKALVPVKGLKTGMVWVENTIMINVAVLYGKDCGLNGHIADVEGFAFTCHYTGASETGWRTDTAMSRWRGERIQTISHASTICEKIETLPYKSAAAPTGKDSVYASPNKHGNYLTLATCNANAVCDQGCFGLLKQKRCKPLNCGELNASLIPDLGTYYAQYAGENPWNGLNFLAAQGGNAGSIKDKMIKAIRFSFINYTVLDTCSKICGIYENAYACGTATYTSCTTSCSTVTPDGTGAVTPLYNCLTTALSEIPEAVSFSIGPNPFTEVLSLSSSRPVLLQAVLYDLSGRMLQHSETTGSKLLLQTDCAPGMYLLQITAEGRTGFYKVLRAGY